MNLSFKSLVGVALQDWGSDRSWEATMELQMRGSPEAWALACRLTKSRNCKKRALGFYIVSQLRQRQKGALRGSIDYALEDSKEILLSGLSDSCKEVLYAVISGLGHRPHPAALPALIQFGSHADQKIRFKLAVALGSYSQASSIEALLRLAKDNSAAVRDWATFGIGTMHDDIDNPEIRDLLWSNLQDTDEDVRGEALTGLAVRKDERIIPVLSQLLDANCRVYELNAAELLGSPLLLERLYAIKDSVTCEKRTDSYWYHRLLDGIDACTRK